MKMDSLKDWYIHLLQDAYDAEKQITKALPKLADAANSAQLRKAFQQHLGQTEKQLQRLEEIFAELGEKPQGEACKGMQGLIEEGNKLLEEKSKFDPDVLDAALIASAQKVEHYEIAGYGTAAAYAELLGEKKAAKVLNKIADEEGATDHKLTALAESSINKQAKSMQKRSNGKGAAPRSKSKSSTKKKAASSTKSKSSSRAKQTANSK